MASNGADRNVSKQADTPLLTLCPTLYSSRSPASLVMLSVEPREGGRAESEFSTEWARFAVIADCRSSWILLLAYNSSLKEQR